MAAEATTLVNGEPATAVSVLDRGFLYGDGLFETIAVYRGAPLLWEQHLARLRAGAERLGIPFPSTPLLHRDATRLSAASERGILKIILTRGVGARGYAPHDAVAPTRVVTISAWPDYPGNYASDGVPLNICETRLGRNRRLAGIKHLNRLEQVLARSEWNTGYAEGLMLDEDGDVIEGTMSNVFVVRKGALCTPDLAFCGVEGIMRAVVIEAARTLGMFCHIGRLTLQDIDAAQELFLTNCLIGVWPVRRVKKKEYTIGPITHAIQKAVRAAHGFECN